MRILLTLLTAAVFLLPRPAPQESAVASPPPAIDANALLRDAEVLSADSMEGRKPGSAGHARARRYIAERFKAAGLEPVKGGYEQPFTYVQRRDSKERSRRGVNLVGVIRGRVHPHLAFVVTAHYDHLGKVGAEVFNGADDNASGTAALVALASQLRATPPAHTFLFAALDAEETGLHGARALLGALPVNRAAVLANVNLDMIGRDANNTLYVAGTSHYPFLKPFVEKVGKTAPVKLVAGHDGLGAPRVEDWTRESDHYIFHEAGIPFLYFGVEDPAHHHRASDDYSTLTHDFYVGAVETIGAVLRELDAGARALVREKKP